MFVPLQFFASRGLWSVRQNFEFTDDAHNTLSGNVSGSFHGEFSLRRDSETNPSQTPLGTEPYFFRSI